MSTRRALGIIGVSLLFGLQSWSCKGICTFTAASTVYSLTVITIPLQPAPLARSPAMASRFGPNNPGAAPPASRHIMESCPRWWIA